ncbi:hypothetical protein GGX14DRAFT_306760, partial [Mycena pura]
PIATLVRCEEKLFVAIGEVVDIRLDSKSFEQLSVDVLRERKVMVHFQLLTLVPATTEDDPSLKHDWRSGALLRDVRVTPGRLVIPVDPALSTRVPGKPYFLFESSVLRSFAAQLLDDVTLQVQLNKKIPKCDANPRFPYREAAGYACFICEGDDEVEGLDDADTRTCSHCAPHFALDVAHPQSVLAHIGSHILHDPKVNGASQLCGLCGGPAHLCRFFLKKSHSAGGGMTVNMALSKCPNLVKKFNYAAAEKSMSQNSPCSNVPLRCLECDSNEPAVWRYNIKYHLQRDHPTTPIAKH